MKIRVVLAVVVLFLVGGINLQARAPFGNSDRGDGTFANPIIWADVPDMSIIRVGDTFWMSSTTMHMNPGVPIMRSFDLVNWEIVSYCYFVLEDTNVMKLQTGQHMYSRGTWASTLGYRDGTFILIVHSWTSGKTYIFQTECPVYQPWRRYEINRVFHDSGMLIGDDGRNWLAWGMGPIYIIELNEDLTGLMPGAQQRVLLPNMHAPHPTTGITPTSGLGEGTQLQKIGDYYFIFGITWPSGQPRTQVAHRAQSLYGPWESRVIGMESINGAGVAQGSIVNLGDDRWYGLFFRDSGAIGRIPWLLPVTWVDGWPMLGLDGGHTNLPREGAIPISIGGSRSGIVASDEFYNNAPRPVYMDSPLPYTLVGQEHQWFSDYGCNGSYLNLVWQWNHNPDNRFWSLTERPGWLRLTTGYISDNILHAPNTLTQRTFGPQSAATIRIDTSGMKPGDEAGISLFTARYGSIGVRAEESGRYIVTTLANFWMSANHGHIGNAGVESARVPLDGDIVYLKAEADFTNFGRQADRGRFYYSLDGRHWTRLGDELIMTFSTNNHFMGYRFALYNFATETVGGHVDFGFFRLNDRLHSDTRPTVLGAAMNRRGDGRIAIYLDPLPDGEFIELATSLEIPAGATVTEVSFGGNVLGDTNWTQRGNQLVIYANGDGFEFAPGARSLFALVSLDAAGGFEVVPDYSMVRGDGNVVFNLDGVMVRGN
ncbi:MAG: glycoside hydrolase 43 family protein [Defluviitaleaceae bacterium]|nr:glycoside hydrolase 43 family protein [Defluviitaleaceae bacterium]